MEAALALSESTQSLTSLLEEVCRSDSLDGSLNSVSDGESSNSQNPGGFISSEDGDNTSECFENTIIELEELIGNEEEFRLFIESMNGGEDRVDEKPILDLNRNVIEDKTVIPVIDITSDDEGLDQENPSENDYALIDSLGTPDHHDNCSDHNTSPVSSPIASSVSHPTSSELLNLGVKDVTASYLDYNKNTCEEDDITKHTKIVIDNLHSKLEAGSWKSFLDENCNAVGYSTELISINSPSPKTEELLLIDTSPKTEEFLVDTSPKSEELLLVDTCPKSEELLSIDTSPKTKELLSIDASPTSEELLLTDTSPKTEESLLPDSKARHIKTSGSAIQPLSKSNEISEPAYSAVAEDKADPGIQTSDYTSIEPAVKAINCHFFKADSGIQTSDCTPIEPAVEAINCHETEESKEIHSLSFYDKLDIEPFEESESAEYELPVPLPSPPPQEIVDEVCSTFPSPYHDTLENESSQEESKLINVESAPIPVIENAVGVSCRADTPASTSTSTPPDLKVPAWQIPWVSTDEAENADNNDPEWDLLRKLETDEERYRVVREKWRQLEIPDPRRDLTCHNYRKMISQSSRGTFSKKRLNVQQSRKRRRSLDENDNENQPFKRRRMVSCTMMYESRINNINGEIRNQFEHLRAAHSKELKKLSVMQQLEHQKFLSSSAPRHIVPRQVNDLLNKQDREIQDLNIKYDEKLEKIKNEKETAIYLLEKASQEVFAFNKFYNDLGSSNDDHCDISEEEFRQFNETEEMYEMYNSIYV